MCSPRGVILAIVTVEWPWELIASVLLCLASSRVNLAKIQIISHATAVTELRLRPLDSARSPRQRVTQQRLEPRRLKKESAHLTRAARMRRTAVEEEAPMLEMTPVVAPGEDAKDEEAGEPGAKIWIVKPVAGNQGHGILVTRDAAMLLNDYLGWRKRQALQRGARGVFYSRGPDRARARVYVCVCMCVCRCAARALSRLLSL